MGTIAAGDGTVIFFREHGTGTPIVFSHDWPLDGDAWTAQMAALRQHGYRVIAHDRRGHGRSGHLAAGHDMDTYADDLAALMRALDLSDATLVGHGAGGGEVARYIGRHGTRRVAKAILIGAVPPRLANAPLLTGIGARTGTDRAQFFRDYAVPFYGYNRPGAVADRHVGDAFVASAMCMAAATQRACVAAFTTPDFTPDLKRFDVPALFIHGGDDQVVPLAGSAAIAAKLVRNCILKIYRAAPHGVCTTHADAVSADIVAFLAD